MIQTNKIKRVKIIFLSLLAFALALSFAVSNNKTEATSSVVVGHNAEGTEQPQAQQEKEKKKTTNNPRSVGCVVCHIGSESMHFDGDDELDIGCADCHGGDPKETQNKYKAHILPRNRKPEETNNPTRVYADWNKESDEYVRFVNPGDLRAADAACGKCHEREVMWMKKSMMTHGAMLWGAALYNNGAYPMKD
jgi:cytochrome c553